MYRDYEQSYTWGIEDANELMTEAPIDRLGRLAYAEGLLQGIFANAPSDCEEIRIGMRRYFASITGKEMFILVDWLHFGNDRTRQRIQGQAEQMEVTQSMINDAAMPAGWTMSKPPSRRPGLEFTYYFIRAELDQHEYQLRSQTSQTIDQRRFNSKFQFS
jgi:hypothetical protein